MIWRKSICWLCLGLLSSAGLAWGETAAVAAPASNSSAALELAAPARYDTSSRGVEAVGGRLPSPSPAGTASPAANSGTAQGQAVYVENHWLDDFEVHFLVSLPFTALYSYAAVSAVDAAVQGNFPTTFRPADLWVVTGLALGSSLAVALGSNQRVPDQSVPRTARAAGPDFSGEVAGALRVALLQIDY